jgi:hypothetical protein
MSIFGVIKTDDKVFTGDQLRIDTWTSFLAPGLTFATSTSHEISVDEGVTWFNVTPKKGIADWIFSTAGDKIITLRLTTSTPTSQTFTKTVKVLDLTAQKLFSLDSDLYIIEPEIDQYLPKRWSSWNLVHLKAQEYIIDWLDEKRIFRKDGTKYVVNDLLDLQEVKQWSVYKTLEFIYEGNSNIVGDISSTKRDKYKLMASEKASRSQLSLNYSGNVAEANQKTDLHVVTVVRG